MTRRTVIEAVVSVVGIALAVLILFALSDVRRWQRGLTRGDARFEVMALPASQFGEVTSPPVSRWKLPHGFVAGATERLLGLRDDVAFRRAVALYRAANPNPNEQLEFDQDPEAPARRIRAQRALTAVSKDDPSPVIRSRAMNLLGILARTGPTAQDPAEERNVILTTIGLFKGAIKLDPNNADAKHNLELVLQDPQTEAFVGTAPSGNPDAGQRAGTGSAGQGY